MNKLKIFFLFICSSCFCQNNKAQTDQEMFNEALTVKSTSTLLSLEGGFESQDPQVTEFAQRVHKRILENTLEIYNDLVSFYPQSKLLNRAHFEMAEIFQEIGLLEAAEKYYTMVFNNLESLNFDSDNTESYYRNEICLILAKRFIAKNDFQTALKYLEESKKYDDDLEFDFHVVDSPTEFEKLYDIVHTGLKSKK